MAAARRSTISSNLKQRPGQELLGNRASQAPRPHVLLAYGPTATLGLAGGIGALNPVWAQADPERTGATRQESAPG